MEALFCDFNLLLSRVKRLKYVLHDYDFDDERLITLLDHLLKPEYLNRRHVANSRRAGVALSESGIVYQVGRGFRSVLSQKQ